MIQPLNGNVKVSKFTDNKFIMWLSLVVLLLLAIIINDKLIRPKRVEFVSGLRTQVIKTSEASVDSFLRSQGVSLSKSDYLLNSLSEQLADGSKITLVRVAEDIIEEEEAIAFTETVKISHAMPAGSRVEIKKGVPGRKKNFFKIAYHNGVQKSCDLMGSRIIQPPVERVVLEGAEKKEASKQAGVVRNGLSFDVVVSPLGSALAQGGSSLAGMAVGPELAGVAVTRKDALPENSIVYVDGFGAFIVRHEDQTLPPALAPASPGSLRLLVPSGLAGVLPQAAKSVRVSLM